MKIPSQPLDIFVKQILVDFLRLFNRGKFLPES